MLITPFDELKRLTDDETSKVIILNRKGKVDVVQGYDGVYGTPMIGKVGPKEEGKPMIMEVKPGAQKGLKDFF